LKLRILHLGPYFYVVFAVLATATQFRPESSSVGFAELGLAGSVLFSGLSLILLRPVLLRPVPILVACFVVVSCICFFVGLLSADGLGIRNSRSIRDAIALLGAISGALIISAFGYSFLDIRRLFVVFVLAAIIPLFALLAAAILNVRVPYIEPWYYEVRFQGWSNNPNQIGLVVTPCLPLAIWLFSTSKTVIEKIFWISVAFMSILVGVYSLSDALIIAWLLSFVVCLFLTTWSSREQVARLISSFSVGGQLFVVASTAIAFVLVLNSIELRIVALMEEGNQAGIRLTLWQHALEAWQMSPLFGLGPGPHSGYVSPLEEVEAHNTMLDWLSASGLIGLTGLILFIALILFRLTKAMQFGLVGTLIGIVVFAQFHFVARHPLFWFVVISCFSAVEALKDSKRVEV
jgi:O-antigen ligase